MKCNDLNLKKRDRSNREKQIRPKRDRQGRTKRVRICCSGCHNTFQTNINQSLTTLCITCRNATRMIGEARDEEQDDNEYDNDECMNTCVVVQLVGVYYIYDKYLCIVILSCIML